MRTIRALALVLAAIGLQACESTTSLDVPGLEGMWTATMIEFSDNSSPQTVVDLIQRDGATYSLTVEASGTASTLFDDGVGGSSSDSGSLNSANSQLTLGGQIFDAVRDGDSLTLTDADELFDFGSGDEVPATLRIVLTR
ncbi:MAG: hypothetical protein AAF389_06495 [Gemmatimonadota bacterium]